MKCLLILAIAAGCARAQTGSAPASLLPAPEAGKLAVRAGQLMESTAAAVPGLAVASEALRRNAGQTAALLVRAPQNAVLAHQYLLDIQAFLALSQAFPRPDSFPQTAAEQFTELREAHDRWQRHLGAMLEAGIRATAAREADPNNLKRYADADAKLPPPDRVPRIVFLGDSITDLWRLNEYFTDHDFVNRGISGQTTTQMLGRFLQDVAGPHPKAVVILGGVNDIARGIPASGIEDNLTMLGELAKAHGIKPLFATLLPVSDYHKGEDPRYEMTKTHPPATIQQVNAWLRDYCHREGFTLVDYYAALVDAAGQLPADASEDGLHPNAKGYRLMAPLALQAIDRALGAGSALPARRAPAK